MSSELIIYGNSSQSEVIRLTYLEKDYQTSLMDFLRAHSIPIASSCYGEGICRKCLVNGTILSCAMTLYDFVQQSDTVTIDYL